MAVETKSEQNILTSYVYPGKPITEIISNGFFTVDRKWTVKYWNKAAEVILGVSAKDIVGKNLWGEFVGIIPLNFYEVYHKAFLQTNPVHFQEFWGEMGTWFDVVTYYCDDILSVSFKTGSQKKQGATTGNVVKELATLNELYRFVTEVTNDCLWEWDLIAGEQFWIDGGHKRVFGYDIVNALIPQSFWENCVHPEDRERVLTSLNKVINGNTSDSWEIEYRFKKSNEHYAWVHDRGHILYDENQQASRMIGATQDITEKIMLQNKLVSERYSKQQEIVQAVLTAQENERAEIGKEMHDNLNQVLAMAKLYVELAKTNDKKRNGYLEKSSGLIVRVIEDIRKISKVLAVPGIQVLGLFGNTKNMIADLAKITKLKIEFYVNGIAEEDLGEKFQLTLFRIIQEQVNNILKHSKASHANINLTRMENKIYLHISDNGIGCDPGAEKNGVGIINIRSRVELNNGIVTIFSMPGKGYELNVVFPFDGNKQVANRA